MSTRPPFLPIDAHRDPPVAIVRIGAVDDPNRAVEAVRYLTSQGFGYFDLEVAGEDALRGLEEILEAAPAARLNVRVGDEVAQTLVEVVHKRDASRSTCFVCSSQTTLYRIRAIARELGFRACTAMSPAERARAIAGASGGGRRLGRSAADCIQVAERIEGLPVDLPALAAAARRYGQMPVYVELDDGPGARLNADRIRRLSDRVTAMLGLYINGVISSHHLALLPAFTRRRISVNGSRR